MMILAYPLCLAGNIENTRLGTEAIRKVWAGEMHFVFKKWQWQFLVQETSPIFFQIPVFFKSCPSFVSDFLQSHFQLF